LKPESTHALIHEHPVAADRGENDSSALFRPIGNNTAGERDKAITPDGIYKLARAYSTALGFAIGAYALGVVRQRARSASRRGSFRP
jgi:integrase/recombinase XerD